MKTLDIFFMDFTIGLSNDGEYRKIYNAILVIVYKLSKMCDYIFFHSEMMEEKFGEVITQKFI